MIDRREVLAGIAASTVVASLPAQSVAATEAVAALPELSKTAVRCIGAHDFLYSDRHEKLYLDIRIYLNGHGSNIEPFVALLEQGATTQEICEALKLHFRGDVWFARLLVHLHIRDGLVVKPNLKVDIPEQLAAKMEGFERVWQRRNDPPPAPKPEFFGPPKPPPPVPAYMIEEEIERIELLMEEHEALRPRLERLVAARRKELARRKPIDA